MITKRKETWNTKNGPVKKIAVRYPDGTFHSATNFVEFPRKRKRK